jgi:photosystem II stability/assembly factor-like uncharacterized protein
MLRPVFWCCATVAVVANERLRSGDRMNDATRRKFLTMAGVGTAAGVAAMAAPGTAAAASSEDVALPADAEGAMVAYIHDVKKGEVALMVEGREVIVTDKRLVARLARAFAKA